MKRKTALIGISIYAFILALLLTALYCEMEQMDRLTRYEENKDKLETTIISESGEFKENNIVMTEMIWTESPAGVSCFYWYYTGGKEHKDLSRQTDRYIGKEKASKREWGRARGNITVLP